jgi:hypothetical protein
VVSTIIFLGGNGKLLPVASVVVVVVELEPGVT